MRTTNLITYKPMMKESSNMMEMDKKKMMRKKALESMMNGAPSIAVKIEKKSMMKPMGEEMEMEEQEGMEGEQEMGMMAMEVTPEEKKLIMSMRKKHKMGMEEESY